MSPVRQPASRDSATGNFGNKDTVANKPVPGSASASPFGCAATTP